MPLLRVNGAQHSMCIPQRNHSSNVERNWPFRSIMHIHYKLIFHEIVLLMCFQPHTMLYILKLICPLRTDPVFYTGRRVCVANTLGKGGPTHKYNYSVRGIIKTAVLVVPYLHIVHVPCSTLYSLPPVFV